MQTHSDASIYCTKGSLLSSFVGKHCPTCVFKPMKSFNASDTGGGRFRIVFSSASKRCENFGFPLIFMHMSIELQNDIDFFH